MGTGRGDARVNRGGVFVAGVVVGCWLMQVGHYLYLRNNDYITAAWVTGICGGLSVLVAHSIAESWQ